MRIICWVVLLAVPLCAHDLLPVPQKVALTGSTFRITPAWRIAGDRDAGAEEILRSELRLSNRGSGPAIGLEIAPGGIENDEGYRLTLARGGIRIAGKTPAGLFYGAATLLQLLDGGRTLPEGEIVDWPDLPYRAIYWDDAHHLDRPDYLKRAVRQAALFKINAFAIKLEGHFQFRSAPAAVEPYAMSPAELQELTDYGLRYHVEVVPYLDGPAHLAFLLKHPEYAALRAFPEINYEMCATNPAGIRLLTGMFQDLLDANRGVRYFYLSTDEPYYVGMADNEQCREKGPAGQRLVDFLEKTAGYLHERGRKPIFWGEAPLKASDIPSLPPYLIEGETYGKEFDAAFRARGIREMVYVSTQGEERLFPDYFVLPEAKKVHPGRPGKPRIEEATEKIATDPARKDGDVMGAIVAAWADAGLHTETFWLGYATISAAAWHAAAPDAAAARAAFYRQFYGPGAVDVERVYELMSRQAQWWSDSWETAPSTSRKPIRGNSRGLYKTPRPRTEQTLPFPFGTRRLEIAAEASRENAELMALLERNLRSVRRNRYSLEVFRTVATLCRHNWNLLTAGKPLPAERDQVMRELTAVWEKSWYPRVAEANGRRFLHELDDIKDHPGDRTVDLSYLVEREMELEKR